MSNLSLEWIKQSADWNTNTSDGDSVIEIDNSSNVIVAFTRNNGGSTGFIRIVKLDSIGNTLWMRDISSEINNLEYSRQPSIAIDSNNDIILAFQTDEAYVAGGSSSIDRGGDEIVLTKRSGLNGDLIWARGGITLGNSPTLTSTLNEQKPQVTIDLSNNIYLYYTSNGAISGSTQIGNYDIIISKHNGSNGIRQWFKRDASWNTTLEDNSTGLSAQESATNSFQKKIVVDSNQNIYFTFISTGIQEGGTQTANSTNKYDRVVVKLDNCGNKLWSIQNSLINTTGYITFGNQSSVISLSPNEQDLYMAARWDSSNPVVGGTVNVSPDIAVWKINASNGNIIWSRQDPLWNTTGFDQRPTIDSDSSGNVYVAYNTASNGVTILNGTSLGGNDVIMFKLDSNGNTIFSNQSLTLNTSSGETAAAIRFKDNYIYLSYNTLGAIEGATNTSINSDIVIAKFSQTTSSTPTINYPPGTSNVNDVSLGSVTVTFPPGESEITIDVSDNINSITLGTPAELSNINSLSNLYIITLEPSGTTFSDYISIDISVNTTTNLVVYYNTGASTTLITDNSNNSTTPYYNTLTSQSIRFFTKSFSDIILGNESGGGIGDPFIKPIFGDSYYLPNDESTYLLFDNKDNLKLYTKTWFSPDVIKMSFMRYLIFEFNDNRGCFDLETFKWFKIDDRSKYLSHTLDVELNDLLFNNIKITQKNKKPIRDYYGKRFNPSADNKVIQIEFMLEKYNIKLEVISDLKFKDIRNNVNFIINGDIDKDTLGKYNGSFISEYCVRKVNNNVFFNKNICLY
jgi:hypothetical protein